MKPLHSVKGHHTISRCYCCHSVYAARKNKGSRTKGNKRGRAVLKRQMRKELLTS